ncbi:MAG: hypothetical protein K2X09_01525 [Rickettsiales bacterium]|nr:hypothetical protein [Rickettsiales bacterium]
MTKLRGISLDEMDQFQLDENGQLHWNNKKVITANVVSLRKYEFIIALVVAFGALATGVEAVLNIMGKCS